MASSRESSRTNTNLFFNIPEIAVTESEPPGTNLANASRATPFIHTGYGSTPSVFGMRFDESTESAEPLFKNPQHVTKTTEVHSTSVRDPPAWKLNYKIGSGAFGTVFLEKVQTREMESPELWAVKRIPRALPNFPAKRYQAEAKNLQALSNHEWFVKFNSSYEVADYVYIAMEFIPIGDMSVTFVDGYRWNESDMKGVIEQLLHGLAVMHEAGITHRDLKPENIFLCLIEKETYALRVKIGDFGTSKRIPHSNASTYLKTTTGTQGYMAPEVHDTSKPKTNRVDIWSLGCVLYRMFAGSPLFNDPVEVWKYAMIASSPLPVIENLGFSIACENFLHDVLQPNPEDRPSAVECLKKDWIISKSGASAYSIGRYLHTKLSKIQLAAPNVHSFPQNESQLAAPNVHSFPQNQSQLAAPIVYSFPQLAAPIVDSFPQNENQLVAPNAHSFPQNRSSEWLWICHECLDEGRDSGLMLVDISPRCQHPECFHTRCTACLLERN